LGFGLVHGLDVRDFGLKQVDGVLDGIVEGLGDLFVGGKEELVNLHWDQGRAFSAQHGGFELVEDGTVDDLRVVGLEWLLFLRRYKVVEQVLHMANQIGAEVLDGRLCLLNLFRLLTRVVLL